MPPLTKFPFSLGKTLLIDTIIHNKNAHKALHTKCIDALSAAEIGKFGKWILGSKDSNWIPRQIIESSLHFSRFIYSFGISATDLTISKIFNFVSPSNQHFSTFASSQRFYKRIMLAMRLNGGPYEEFASLIRTILLIYPPNHPVFGPFNTLTHEYPVIAKPEPYKLNFYGKKEHPIVLAKTLFKQQTGLELFDMIKDISHFPRVLNNSLIVLDAVTKNDVPISITILPPNQYRMNQLDLIPFRLMRLGLCFVPFIKPEKALIDAVIGRFSYDLNKEMEARVKILKSFGVDTEAETSTLFKQANSIKTTMKVPAPIQPFCGKYIMITDRMPPPFEGQLTKKIATNVSVFFSDLLFKKEIVLPDVSLNNLLCSEKGMAFSRYGTATEASGNLINSLLKLGQAVSQQNASNTDFIDALRIKRSVAERSIETGKFDFSLTREIMKHHSKPIIGIGEGVLNLMRFTSELNRYSVMSPFVIGATAKYFSPNANQDSFPFSLLSWTKYLPL